MKFRKGTKAGRITKHLGECFYIVRCRLKSTGLEPVLSNTDKSCKKNRITDNFPRINKNNKIKTRSNKTGFNFIIFHFNIRESCL